MSVIAKQAFASELKERLYDKLTMKDADAVIAAVIEQMGRFDIEQLDQDDYSKEYEDMVNIYVDALRVEGRSERTLQRYKRELMKFNRFDPTPLRHITVFNLRQYFAAEKARGLSDNTVKGNREVFHAYFGWLHREGLLQSNPCGNLRSFKAKVEEKQPFSDIEIERLKSGCTNPKDRAIVSFLLSTGCRIGEVVKLNRDDIDFRTKEVKVCGKGNKERYVYFNDVTAMYLQMYLNTRTDDLDALFVSKFNRRMNEHSHQAKMRDLGKRVGIENVHPHRFRHTFASNLIRNGMPIQEVSILMGHARLETTQIYAHTSQERVKLSYFLRCS